MKNHPYIPRKTSAFFPRLSIDASIINGQITEKIHLNKVISREFFVISDGEKRTYTESDALSDYGPQKILDPHTVSYMNLFINGILQPKMNYEVTDGRIILLTEDIPFKGCPIILQMIIFK